jgi:universal stress protein E
MSFALRHILVAVGPPTSTHARAIRRAAELAAASGARLELFHANFNPYAGDPVFMQQSLDEQMDHALEYARRRLERLAAPLRRRGLQVATTVAWDYPAHEAIVRRVLDVEPDLLVAEAHKHGVGERLVLTNTDWQLVRLCPVPLLLARSRRSYSGARFVAAIDPFHAHAKPADLDRRILDVAVRLAIQSKAEVHAAHVYRPPAAYIPGSFAEPVPIAASPILLKPFEDAVRARVAKFLRPLQRRIADQHVVAGDPVRELPVLARNLGAALAIMGAVSRSGLKSLFIGHTAERVLDRMTCDVLVVKPRAFRTAVPRKATLPHIVVPPF